ncbi:SDR family NAD(P)-dependent oxidoreductase [Nocardia sp. alder85J]|uniref:SDR family NAD(P)-dependent oxidoreductase n=1 Tax=Nocardia sp. alder85J TaxID=2862949 RepID=UPI001CD5D5A7|nr:SDR family oxidoreductase [Nocardia sp. alder85J]MCX4095830.1 SDR family oxidoreductase [Nocardia sp. alder85J]
MAVKSLAGRVALISGAGRGIGRATALKLAAEGARVVINDRDAEPAREAVQAVAELGGEAVACVGDVTAAGFGERFVAAAVDNFGGLDIVVNNAGMAWNAFLPAMTDTMWSRVLDIHLSAAFRVLRAAQPVFAEQARNDRAAGHTTRRAVVNVGSIVGSGGNPSQANYAAAKSGLFGLTRTLAQEWGRYDVTVNSVAFGVIRTRMTSVADPAEPASGEGATHVSPLAAQVLADAVARSPLRRPGTPEEAADSVWMLCAPESSYLTGQVLLCAGGLTSVE